MLITCHVHFTRGQLISGGLFGDHAVAATALGELSLLFDYLEAMGSLQYISLDMSLARGLDYYTGVIYEAVITSGTSQVRMEWTNMVVIVIPIHLNMFFYHAWIYYQVGSIAAGGRYDNLAGMFSVSGQQTPCVGVSIGIERVLTIMEQHLQGKAKKSTVQVGLWERDCDDTVNAWSDD